MKKIFISGSEGNICTKALIPFIKKLGGYEVIRFDKVLGDDLLDPDTIYRKLKKGAVDTVLHTAGVAGPTRTNIKELYKKVNTDGSINLLKAASEAKVKKFIFFSSFSYYGVDSWMRHRDEAGPITGEDLAVPRYLPIDEEHPSILEYDLDKLCDYNGKYYGMSKAMVEKFARDNAHRLNCSFISMRLAGFTAKTWKYRGRKRAIIERSKRGLTDMRKQLVYGVAGIATKAILTGALEAILKLDFKKYDAYNICEANTGLQDVVRAYFPGLAPTDRIFANQKILLLMNKAGVSFTPEPELKDAPKTPYFVRKILKG